MRITKPDKKYRLIKDFSAEFSREILQDSNAANTGMSITPGSAMANNTISKNQYGNNKY